MKSLKKKLIKFNYKGIKFKIINSNFGVIDVKKLLKLKSELELYNFYLKYKKYYKSFGDIGANVGIHSLFASRIFKNIYSYEPLADHYSVLKKNVKLNKFKNIRVFKKAISYNNKSQYLNVLKKNTTATHLEAASRTKYGIIIKKLVKCISIEKINNKIDLIKLDVEGLESKLIKKINFKYKFSDFIIEIHNKKNSKEIYKKISVCKNLSAYKLKKSKLSPIRTSKDMPISTKDGNLFLTKHSFNV
jgi:FkbM family methyltransferase